MTYWRKASRLNALPIHPASCRCEVCNGPRRFRDFPIVEEVRDAQRADGWRFWILALGFVLLLLLANGAIGALLDWAQTDAVEMTR